MSGEIFWNAFCSNTGVKLFLIKHFNSIAKATKRLFWIGVASFMIGVSNVIMEEDRSIHDTRMQVEQKIVEPEEE
ncbi:MAG: hypothetical protein ED555_07095 [Allomuricauda sp.]|nr:MAG: hypothetical protein ED555_07095 [Allomuricauda sp.]